jgi:hypothetical protein
LRRNLRDDDIVVLPIDLLDALQGNREILERVLLPDQALPSRCNDRWIERDIRGCLEVHRSQYEARFRELLGGNAGNGLAEPAAERALTPRWRRDLLPHDGVLIDGSLERHQDDLRSRGLRLGCPGRKHGDEERQDEAGVGRPLRQVAHQRAEIRDVATLVRHERLRDPPFFVT